MSIYRSKSLFRLWYKIKYAMSASVLKDLIIKKMSSISSSMDSSVPPLAHKCFSDSITEYITSNVKVVGSYSGVTPIGAPESVPVDTWNITGVMPILSVPSNFSEWISNISNGIKSSFYLGYGVSRPLAPTIAFPLCNVIPDLNKIKSIHESNYSNPQDSVILEVCEWITDSLELGVIKTVPAGLTGTGVYTISKVLI